MMLTCECYLLRQLESDLVKPSCIFCFKGENTVVSEQSMHLEEPLWRVSQMWPAREATAPFKTIMAAPKEVSIDAVYQN